jgi:hypothetical protein
MYYNIYIYIHNLYIIYVHLHMYIIFILLFVLPPVALFGARNFKNLYILLASTFANI